MALSAQLSDTIELFEPRATGIVTIAEYRRLTEDKLSSDEKVLERIIYLEKFCRVVIQTELNNHDKKNY